MRSRSVASLLLCVSILVISSSAAHSAGVSPAASTELQAEFRDPPDSARPWVYWFWKNGNISREGITEDLEAMKRVGIGGVILMEVALVTPPGPIEFFSEPWRDLFRHAVSEATRLGLQISVNSAPGWTGSGGPWVKPEQSMQKVVGSETQVSGPRVFDQILPQPETVQGFYRDIAVLAFPTPSGQDRIADIREKALYERGPISSMPGVRPSFPAVPQTPDVPDQHCVSVKATRQLTDHMDGSGRLVWQVPAGEWTIVRLGCTSTGQTNRPAALPGLECDKLDPAALDEHFAHFTAQLLRDVGGAAGSSLVATHLDSWEVGGQNWTGRFREEFQARRGYDPLPYLPAMLGWFVESPEISERFLWDLRQTVSDMIVEYHGRHMRTLANQHGLWFSIEPYDMTPCDDMTLGATADVPMCEFWTNTFDTRYSVKEATSVGHVYGRPIIAAEAFTSTESWLFHPATMKPFGDWAFAEGVNRFVIHRYVHQPFAQIRPGLSLGPHGIHYERTQTWWELTHPWHTYLARCQHLLQQGTPVADILYLSPEGAPNVFQRPDPEPVGYHYDACTPEALLERISVHNGRLVRQDGESYALLVLPDSQGMTPQLLTRLAQLVREGAIVIGDPPRQSPSLTDYPACDEAVRATAQSLWGTTEPASELTWRKAGAGSVIAGGALRVRQSDLLSLPDMAPARWIWGGEGHPAAAAPVGKRYFQRSMTLDDVTDVESAQVLMTADNAFTLYINGQQAATGDNFTQIYVADVARLLRTGANLLAVEADNGGAAPNPAGLIALLAIEYRDGRQIRIYSDNKWRTSDQRAPSWTQEAVTSDAWEPAVELGPFGMSPWIHTRVVEPPRAVYPRSLAVQEVLDRLRVPPDLATDAPLRFAHRRTDEMDLYFVSNGEPTPIETICTFRVTGRRPELWHPETGEIRPLTAFTPTNDDRVAVPLRFDPHESYFIVWREPPSAVEARSEISRNFPHRDDSIPIPGPWHLTFDPHAGGPAEPITWETLDDWSHREEPAIRFYSGTAVYRTRIACPDSTLPTSRARRWIDLGVCHEFARMRLNGRDLGIAWKAPFRFDVTDAWQPGENELEIEVTNLWPNRMIGDEHLPLDCELTPARTIKHWPDWLLQGHLSPTGRYTFASWRHWTAESPLIPSGLLGPVTVQVEHAAD